MRRRSAVEPVIGHLKDDHRMDRNFLAGRQRDAANAVLAAVGYHFSLPLKWFAALLRAFIGRLTAVRAVGIQLVDDVRRLGSSRATD
jgi:IS5 family transposase